MPNWYLNLSKFSPKKDIFPMSEQYAVWAQHNDPQPDHVQVGFWMHDQGVLKTFENLVDAEDWMSEEKNFFPKHPDFSYHVLPYDENFKGIEKAPLAEHTPFAEHVEHNQESAEPSLEEEVSELTADDTIPPSDDKNKNQVSETQE